MKSNFENKTEVKSTEYVLITPARNEEKFITLTLESVINQTALPLRWVIISDGSTDKTDEIVTKYCQEYDFIKLIKRNSPSNRNFASKVYAIKEGYDSIKDLNFSFVGFSDADMSCEANFYESLIKKMLNNPQQGIGGAVVFEKKQDEWIAVKASYDWSVSGTMQMFRRKCYEQIGGYQPLEKGGVDASAEIMARMYGWEVRTFEDLKLFHFRIMGSNKGNSLKFNFHRGTMEYSIGYHPLFQIARFFSRIPHPPFFLASLMRTVGYFYAMIKCDSINLPQEVIKYFRTEQISRLFSKYKLQSKNTK